MQYTKVEIQGREGRATVQREGHEIVIRIRRDNTRKQDIRVDARCIGEQLGYEECDAHIYLAACKLQEALDGHKGTKGDIWGYRQVLAHFEC